MLIKAIADQADRTAFARLFTIFAPRVKGYLIGLGTPGHTAEELAQETLLALWRRADSFDPAKSSAATWVFTIARNLRIDSVRRERMALAYQLGEPSSDQPQPLGPERAMLGCQRQEQVAAAIATLSSEQQAVIREAFFLDRPHPEIARSLGLPLGTVKSRVRLALAQLRGKLDDLL